MNRILEQDDDDDEEDNTDTSAVGQTVDQYSSIQSPANSNRTSIYSSKQTITSEKNDRSKYQTTNRPSSLPPARHSSSINENIDKEVKQRRRFASDSNTNNNKTSSALLVTSFLQYLRNELRATTTDKTNDYQRHIKQKSYSSSVDSYSRILMNSKISNDNLSEINDRNEILTLVDLLVLRVECLTNENDLKKSNETKTNYPTVAEVDQNLIEYLYYLFTKFVHDDPNESTMPIIDKKNFVTVCQTLVRNGCFDMPSSTSPDQSASETISNNSDPTIIPDTYLHEYRNSKVELSSEKITNNEQETWLVVDLQPTQSEEHATTSEIICLVPTSTSDEQLVSLTNDFDHSYESESSPSIYLSPNASLIDLQTMVQEFDEINNQLFAEDGSTSNVIIESKTDSISNDDDNQSLSNTSNNICTSLTNDDSLIDNSEQLDKMSRREKKMQERWSTSIKTETNDQSSSSPKPLIGIDFPQISVLRRKFSSSPTNKKQINPDTTTKTSSEEINTLPTTSIVDNTNPDQINELPLKDLSLTINTDVENNNDNGQLSETVIEQEEEDIMMKKKQDPLLLSTSMDCHPETIINNNNELVENQETNNENSSLMITNLSNTNLLLSSSSPPSSSSTSSISISPSSSLPLTTNENNTIEPLLKEHEEKKKEEEEQHCNIDYNLDEKKKNSSFVYDDHASGIILINDEPTQTALLQQEKKENEEKKEKKEEERERPSSPLLTREQFNQQRTEDESPSQILSNDLNQMAMTNIDENEERYKKVEIEEIPDDEEAISTQNIDSIEPTDYIHTDDEPTKKTKQSNNISTITDDDPLKFDNVFSCYEKALAKVVDTSYDDSSQPSNSSSSSIITTQQNSGQDPIALRALQRFEERMNAANAKSTKPDTNSLAAKGKSSWSGSFSTPRKSLENLFKPNEQQLTTTPIEIDEDSSKNTNQSESYIRRRKTFDENSLIYNTTSSIIDNDDDNQSHQQEEKEQQPSAILENDDKRAVSNNDTTITVDSIEQPIVSDTTNVITPTSTENSLNTIMSQSLSNEQLDITPYRFQIEGRRRLNTHERMREHRKSREELNTTDDKFQQIKNDYTLKPEEVQDPIIRRALERFDEKNRTLAQTKSMNYDEIQDPITRRALMRLESNLKRTIPSTPPTINNSNENRYTESYTLGSLQPTNDRLSRYNTDSSQSSLLNNKTKYVSVHQHYCTPSSNEPLDLAVTNEQDIPVMRVPTQPIYLTSNNQPLTLRQRSRSEDMLTSKDLIIGQTTNLDDVDTTTTTASTSGQLQRNRSSNEIAVNEPNFHLPNSLIKTLEPNFVRTTESSVSYATPTQTYSAYSCEYTRPRRNPLVTTETTKQESYQLPSTYSQQQQNEIQRPTPYRPADFTPSQPSSTTTATGSYYSHQPLSTSSYTTNTTSYTEDPIVRRALERFNSQMQNSLLSTSQYQSTNNYLSRPGNFYESNRPSLMTTSTSSIGGTGGYQSIIGRRRQAGTRPDDLNTYLIDNSSVGDGYSSSLFVNSQNTYPMTNHYMNMSDDPPPAIPPRYRRDNNTYRHEDINDQYRRHSTDEYLSENLNNNNNNSHTLPRETFIHHAYPATITNSTGFRPINIHYNQYTTEQDDVFDRAQSTSSTNSSDSYKQQRSNLLRSQMNNQQRIPINEQLPSEEIIINNGNQTGDSVFHRLAYTGTKTALSRSSSNSCSNLLNKNASQNPSNQLQSCEIDFDDSLNTTIIDHTNEQITSNKYQRSKSVDTRARLKLAQSQLNDDNNDEQQKTIPSSKFTPINSRPPPRVPLTPTTTATTRTALTKRSTNGIRQQNSNGNMYDQDIENEENISYHDDNYQTKLSNNNRIGTNIPVHRYTTNNIQPSPSTSSVSSNISRTKPPMNLDRRDSNISTSDANRTSRRTDDNRVLSPTGQRRNVPVSVFSPAKLDNKRPAPAPPTMNYESQQQTSYLSRTSSNEQELNSSSNNNNNNNNRKSTGNLLNEYSSHSTDKHDNTKKMNVFERLFRGNKKKS